MTPSIGPCRVERLELVLCIDAAHLTNQVDVQSLTDAAQLFKLLGPPARLFDRKLVPVLELKILNGLLVILLTNTMHIDFRLLTFLCLLGLLQLAVQFLTAPDLAFQVSSQLVHFLLVSLLLNAQHRHQLFNFCST